METLSDVLSSKEWDNRQGQTGFAFPLFLVIVAYLYLLHPMITSAHQRVRASLAWRATQKHEWMDVTDHPMLSEALGAHGRRDCMCIVMVLLPIVSLLCSWGLSLSVDLAILNGKAHLLDRPPPVVVSENRILTSPQDVEIPLQDVETISCGVGVMNANVLLAPVYVLLLLAVIGASFCLNPVDVYDRDELLRAILGQVRGDPHRSQRIYIRKDPDGKLDVVISDSFDDHTGCVGFLTSRDSKTSTAFQWPSRRGKEMLTTRLESGLGEVTLKSDVHALHIVVPNLEHAVHASIFVDNSASWTVIGGRKHIVLPIVTCGPAGLSFAQPLRLRFHLCDANEASESSDVDSNDGTCSVENDGRSNGSRDGGGERLRCYKVVVQKGRDTSSKGWTVLDGTVVSEGDNLFLEVNISHFCRFGLAQEIGRYEESDAGYIEADLSRTFKQRGTARFVNLSDHITTFYLQPKVFDTDRHESGGFSIRETVSALFSKHVKRTALATETTLFADTVQLGPNEFGDGRIGESVGSQAAVAVTTSEDERVRGWWRSACVRKVFIWDNKTAIQKKALILMNSRFSPPKYPLYGHFTLDASDEAEANIARKVYDAITKSN